MYMYIDIISDASLIIFTYSNVQSHSEDDVYRRVRVSSERFITRVWQYSNARQFLARAGWVEVCVCVCVCYKQITGY